ncbi:MAG TPA: cupin domain-containing protein [Gemmatimonadaceae bacterium]|nr:cupin domain-containing protein [Gemmatimonadaceae bacterium]
MSYRSLSLLVAALVALHGATADAQKTAKLQWGPAPPVLPAGARMAVVSGDPGKAAMFTVQLEMPAGYVVPPHWHPTDEHVTVKSGQFRYAMGDKIDEKATKALRPGQSVNLQAKMNHYAMARGRTVVAISGMGPFQITYVNPADDPQKMKP